MNGFARLVIGMTALLFVLLNLVQIIAFGAPFGVSAAPDFRITGYSVADARAFLDAIGDSGRGVFFGYFRWLDTVFPPLLALSLVILFRQIRPLRRGLVVGLFALLPLAYLVADLAENAALKTLQTEEGFARAVSLASDATILKYSILGVTALLLLLFAVLERKASR